MQHIGPLSNTCNEVKVSVALLSTVRQLCRPFRRLERLECCGNGVGDEGVKELIWLQSLRHLCLGQNPRISDKSMLFLSGLGQLRTLNLTGTALTNNGILPLRALTVRD